MSDRLHDVEPRDAMPDKTHMITALALNVERKRVERLRRYIRDLESMIAPTMANDARIDGHRTGLQPGDLTEGEA